MGRPDRRCRADDHAFRRRLEFLPACRGARHLGEVLRDRQGGREPAGHRLPSAENPERLPQRDLIAARGHHRRHARSAGELQFLPARVGFREVEPVKAVARLIARVEPSRDEQEIRDHAGSGHLQRDRQRRQGADIRRPAIRSFDDRDLEHVRRDRSRARPARDEKRFLSADRTAGRGRESRGVLPRQRDPFRARLRGEDVDLRALAAAHDDHSARSGRDRSRAECRRRGQILERNRQRRMLLAGGAKRTSDEC